MPGGRRAGEKCCRARFCVPLSIIIVATHFALWWYVIYPRLIGSDEEPVVPGKPVEFGPGYSDKAYLLEDGGGGEEESYDASKEMLSTTPFPEGSFQATSHEYASIPSTSVENMRQEYGQQARELQRPPTRHHHNHRHLYYVKRKRPLKFASSFSSTPPPSMSSSTTTTPAITEPRRILENFSTRRYPYQQPSQQQHYPWGSRDSSTTTTVNPSTKVFTNFIAHVTATTTTRHHHHQHRHQHHHQHSTTTTTTPPPSPLMTPQFRHHHHFDKEKNEELQRQREAVEREKERREQERMRQLTDERSRLRLTEEQERRAQAIYDSQQRSLKQRKEEEARIKIKEEETRRREEHERKLKQWEEDERRRQQQPQPHPPPAHQSNQWHHPRLIDSRHPEAVADPMAHMRQIEEQHSTSVILPPATQSPGGISNEIDPYSITSHRIEEANGVWRGHVDHQNAHPNAIQNIHHQSQHQSESDPKSSHEERQRKLEYDRRLKEWHQQNQARQHHQSTPQPSPSSSHSKSRENIHHHQQHQQQQQHHHHTLQGNLSSHHHQQQRQHHHHQKHDEISNEIVAMLPAANRDKRDGAPVIVTALLDIGRGEWFSFTRPYDLYLDYLMDLLKLQNRFIIYGDRQVLEKLEQHRDIVDFDRIQFIELALDDLPYSRYRNEIKEIMDVEQKEWQKDWERATKTHPEAINPDYNILVNSKPYILYNATQISKFNSENYIWVDAGYSHGDKNAIPAILWNPALPPGRMTVIKITPDQDKVTNYAIEHVYRKSWTVMSGGILAGDVATIHRFHRFYYKTFMDLLDARKTDDDQTTLLMTIVNYHSIFNILTGGWFDAFKLLPSQ